MLVLEICPGVLARRNTVGSAFVILVAPCDERRPNSLPQQDVLLLPGGDHFWEATVTKSFQVEAQGGSRNFALLRDVIDRQGFRADTQYGLNSVLMMAFV